MSWILDPLRFLKTNIAFILKLTRQELGQAMSGSLMGGFWIVLQPLVTFAAYIILFSVLLRVQINGLTEGQFVSYILTGLASGIALTLATTSGAASLVSNTHLLKGTLIDPQIIPIKSAFMALPTVLVGFSLVVMFGLLLGFLGLFSLLIVVYLFFFVVLVIGLSWLLSTVCLLLRDLLQVIPAILTPMMLTSPLAFTLDNTPSYLEPFLYMNPYTYVVVIPQQILVLNRIPDMALVVPFITVAVISYFTGYFSFRRATHVLFDNV